MGRRARTPPPTCKAFATPWRFRIWRHVGTTGSDGRAVSSTSTRTPPPSPRYVHRIIPSSGRQRSSTRNPSSPFLRFSSREKRGRVLIRVSQIALIPRVLASRFCFESCSMSSLCLVYNFLFYDYSYLRIVSYSFGICKTLGIIEDGKKGDKERKKEFLRTDGSSLVVTSCRCKCELTASWKKRRSFQISLNKRKVSNGKLAKATPTYSRLNETYPSHPRTKSWKDPKSKFSTRKYSRHVVFFSLISSLFHLLSLPSTLEPRSPSSRCLSSHRIFQVRSFIFLVDVRGCRRY